MPKKIISLRNDLHFLYVSFDIYKNKRSNTILYFSKRALILGNKVLTAKLLRQGYRYHKPRKAFSKFYRRLFDLVSKYNVGLKTLLLQGLCEPEFYGDLAYKFRKIIGKYDFSYLFK